VALPQVLLSAMERLFNVNLTDVRVRTGSLLAELLGARAFARGNRIYFAPGQYKPDTEEGRGLIGHELAHVVQQLSGRVRNRGADGCYFLHDEELEQEAEEAGALAAAIGRGGLARARLHLGHRLVLSADRNYPLQCLMSTTEFRRATGVSSGVYGFRSDEIRSISTKLENFRRLEGPVLGELKSLKYYQDLQRAIDDLLLACGTYLVRGGARSHGVLQLVKQAKTEKIFLDLMVKGMGLGGIVSQTEALDSALSLAEEHQFTGPDWSRKKDQVVQALSAFQGTGVENARQLAQRDVETLKGLAQNPVTPDILKSILQEITVATNLNALRYQFGNAGFTPKVDHFAWRIDATKTRTYRLGQVAHELTHLSAALKFGWRNLMLCFPTDADDDEIKDFARLRRGKMSDLDLVVDESNLQPVWKAAFKGQIEYATDTNAFSRVLGAFQPLIGDDYRRFANLLNLGNVGSLLHEYDTVVNQMTMWCLLLGQKETSPLFHKLLELAGEAYRWRAKYHNGNGGIAHNPNRRRALGI